MAGNNVELVEMRSKALLAELQRVYGQLERNNEGPLSVIQFIILALGAALIAAADVPEAFVAVPISLTAWLLYSRLVDFNTMKLAIYARHLETELNAALQDPVFLWESRLTQRDFTRPLIFRLNFVYWAVISAASWIAGVAVLLDQGRNLWAGVLGAIGLLLMVAVLYDHGQRRELLDRLYEEMDGRPGGGD